MENHASAAAYVPSFGVLSSRGSNKPTKATHPAGQSSRTDGEQPPRPPLTSSASWPLLPSSDSALPLSASFPSATPQTMGSSSSSWVPYPTASRQQQQQQHMPGGSASARVSMRHVASTSALYIPTFASPHMSGGATVPPTTARSVAAAPATARPPTRAAAAAAAAPSDAAFFSSCDGGAATSSTSVDPVDHYPPLSILLQASGAPQVTGKKRGKKKSPSSRNASSSSSLGKALAMDGAAAGASSITTTTTATAMASPAATESEPKHHAPAPEGWRPHSDAEDHSGTDKKASPPPSAASLEQELRRLLSSSTTTTAAAVGMPDSVPVLIPQEEMKFIFATLTWNVDLLLILLSNAPNPVELTERREEAEAAALRDMAAAETERKKRHREHTAAPRQPSAPHRSPPLGERSSFPGNNHSSHNNTTVDSVNQIDPAINENNTAWDVLSPPPHPQQQQRQPATWRERLTRRQEDTDEGSEDGESDLARQEQHLRAVMSLPTLSDLEKLTALSPSMRPAVFEARRHQQLDTIARANANHGGIYAGWDTHNLLSLSTQTGGDSGGHNPRQPFSLENINANEDEEADAERPASSQCPNSPFHPSTTSEASVATATTATFPSSTGTGRRHPLRSLCGVDPQYFPTLEEVQQWLEKDGVHASAASLWRRLQDRRRAAAAAGGGGGGGRGNTAAATPQREDGWSSRDYDESRAGSVRSDVTGGDRVRRNRTFCFAAAASAAAGDVDGNDGDGDDDDARKVTAQARQGDQQRPQRGRPPRLLPILTSAPISPSVSVSCSPMTMSPVTSYPKLSEMTESPRATDSLTSLTPQKQRQQQQQQTPSPTGAETVLRRHPSAESLFSLLSGSANVGGGGGVQHQSSRRGGKKKARGTRRHTTGRTMKIHVSSITEGPKAHLLYTAPTAEADQLYEQLLRLRQQQQQQQSCEEVGRPRTTHATSSPIAPLAAAGATAAANKKREEQAQSMSAVAGWPSRASADSSITSGSGGGGETVENKRRRVMALLMRSAESLRFQPWEIPSSLLHPSPPPPVAGSTDNDPKPPSVLSKPTAPSSSPSFLSGAKLAFGSAYTPGGTPSCAAAAATTNTRGGHADVTMDDEHDAVREERESEVARVARRLAEGKVRGSDPQSLLLSDTALEAEVDDMNHLEVRFPYDQDEDAYNDDDAGSASNESEEPLFHLPARIGRRIDDGAPKSKASKFYFFGPRRATLSRPASGVLPMAPSSSSLGSLAGHGHGSVADLSAIPPGKIVGKGRGGHGSSASMATYSAVVRGGAGEAAATSTMTATTTHNNHKRNVLGKRKSSAVASPPGRAKRSDGRDGCGKRAEEEESEEERGHTSAFAPAALEAVESKKRKADIQAFVQVFLRAFFVTVIAQVRLQSATNDGVSHLSPGGAPTSLPSPPSPSSSAQVQAHQQPAQLLSPVEVCALLFLQRHFLSFKEVVERYVMHSDQEVVRRSAQAIFGDTLCTGANHRRTAELDRKGTEEEEGEDTDKTLAPHPRPRTSPSLASSAIGTPSAPPSYRDALTANTKAKPPMEPLILDVDGEEESLDKMRKDGLAHREKTEKSPPPADLLMDSDLLHTILSPDNVAALRQLGEQQRQQQQQQHGRKNTMTPSQQNEEEEEEEEPYCETDDVEPLSIDQLYLSGKDAAWQPLLLDALGITRVLQCYPETTNMQRVNNSNRNGNATAQESPNRLGQQQQQQQSVDVNLPPLGVAAGGGGGGGGGGIHSGSTLVSHQQVVLGALKAFLLKQTRPSHCETDSLANSSLRGDEEESLTYLHYLIPYLGSPEQQQEQQQPPSTLCGAGACVTSTEGVASRPSNDADKGAGVWPCSTSFHGLLDPLHWIPYAFLPSPYSTATSNYSTELFVAQLPVSGRLLYRWVIPAEDTDKYNLSVFFQSSLFSFLQGGPVPSPTTESGFLIDLQLRHHLHLQQQQQQYGERSSGSGGVVGRASVGVNRPPLLPSPASQRESTLVHCSAGMHRSSGMVIAFLLWLLYQCAQLTTTLTKHSEQQQGEAAGERWEDGKRENARAVAASQSATAIPDPMSAPLFALFTTLLRQRPTSAEVGTDAPAPAAAAAATGADYRSNPLMTDASEVLVRAIKHVKQRRGVAEPIATVQYLLKHFAAELQLP